MRAGEDTVVNNRLWDTGATAYRDNKIYLYHRSRCKTPWRLFKHHFVRGRAWGKILINNGKGSVPLKNYVKNRFDKTSKNITQWGGDLCDIFEEVRFLVKLGIMSAWLGAYYEQFVLRLKISFKK